MPVTKKTFLEEKKQEAAKASQEQMNDIFATISALGTTNSNTSEMKALTEQNNASQDFKTVTTVNLQTDDESQSDEKPGYISLVIPNNLKKKWKIFSAMHNMSLTNSLKLGMKLLEELEQNKKIKIEGGFVTFNV